jgi:hypothetical protein
MNNNKFIYNTINIINTLNTTGKKYRQVTHTLNNVITQYTDIMHTTHSHLGNNYLQLFTQYIMYIFNNYAYNYDALELINNVIKWYFKTLAFKYNLTKQKPNLPDYTIAEIQHIYNTLINEYDQKNDISFTSLLKT